MFQRFPRLGLAGAGCGQARDNCAQERRHDLRRIVLLPELAPMVALRACARLPETVQERVEALQVTWERTQVG